MSFEEKEMGRYLDGLVVLFHLINTKEDLGEASDAIHDLLLGYDIVDGYKKEFKEGYKDVKDIFVDFPRNEDVSFERNDSLMNHLEKYE